MRILQQLACLPPLARLCLLSGKATFTESARAQSSHLAANRVPVSTSISLLDEWQASCTELAHACLHQQLHYMQSGN